MPAHSLRGGGGNDRSVGLASAAAEASHLRRIRRDELIAINSLVVQKPRRRFRKEPVWVGASHPSLAWHVGSPPVKLNELVDAILAMAQSPWPITLIALVSLLRLLQVHPFIDGNGRTARLYACWLVRQRIGHSPCFLALLDALWKRSEFSINAAGVSIRDHDDWPNFFDYCLHAAADKCTS